MAAVVKGHALALLHLGRVENSRMNCDAGLELNQETWHEQTKNIFMTS